MRILSRPLDALRMLRTAAAVGVAISLFLTGFAPAAASQRGRPPAAASSIDVHDQRTIASGANPRGKLEQQITLPAFYFVGGIATSPVSPPGIW